MNKDKLKYIILVVALLPFLLLGLKWCYYYLRMRRKETRQLFKLMTFKGNSHKVSEAFIKMNVEQYKVIEKDYGLVPWNKSAYHWFGFKGQNLGFWLYGYFSEFDRYFLYEQNRTLMKYIEEN